jgi:hypothetical protein
MNMTSKQKDICKSIEKKYKKFGDEFHLTKDGSVFIFNNKTKTLYTTGSYQTKKSISVKEKYLDDYCVKTNHSLNLISNISFQLNAGFKKSYTEVTSKVTKFKSLINGDIVLAFTLSKSLLDAIKSSGVYYKSTHIEFSTQNSDLMIRLFDFRNYLQQEFNCGYAEYVMQGVISPKQVRFSLRQSSIDKLIDSDYEVCVLDNEIIRFETITDDIQYFFRTQNTRLPVIEFDHSLINKHISLLLEPKLT